MDNEIKIFEIIIKILKSKLYKKRKIYDNNLITLNTQICYISLIFYEPVHHN